MLSILGSGNDKTYPIPYLVELINFIAAKPDIVLLFNYMPKQRNEALHIYNLCSEKAKAIINLEITGENLRSLMGILSHCQLLIGNDGGAVNIAKALQKPTFTIFSPWIQKESWSIFEDGKFHKAVHLNDFMPEQIGPKKRKELKKRYAYYYEMFKPSFLFDSLDRFLETNLK